MIVETLQDAENILHARRNDPSHPVNWYACERRNETIRAMRKRWKLELKPVIEKMCKVHNV